MKKLLKILVWIAGGLVVLLVIGVIALWLFFPLEKVKEMAIAEGSAALGRPVLVNEIDLSIWGGLGVNLREVSISSPEGFGGQDLLKAEAVDVKLQLWPLINGDYQIDKLIIDRPNVQMIKLPDGSNNYTFALAGLDSTQLAIPENLKQTSPETQAAAVVVAFDRLEINEGTIRYDDQVQNFAAALNGVNLSTSLSNPRSGVYKSSGRMDVGLIAIENDSSLPDMTVDLNYSADYDLENDALTIEKADLMLNRLGLHASGAIQNLTTGNLGSIRLKTDQLAFGDLIALLNDEQKASLAGYNLEGKASVDAEASWSQSDDSTMLKYTGTAELTDVLVGMTEVNGNLAIRRALLDFESDQARLTLDQATFNDKPIKGYLTVQQFDNPRLNGELSGNLDLAFVAPFMPQQENQELAGMIQFDITLNGEIGKPAEMSFAGDLAVTDGSYSSSLLPERVKAFELSVSVAPGSATIHSLSAQFESTDISITGRIEDPFPYLLPIEGINRAAAPRPRAEIQISSHRFDVDRLFPEAVPGSGAVPVENNQMQLDSVITLPLPDIDGKGTLSVDTLIYNQIEFTKITGQLRFKDRKITCYNATGDVYSGKVSGETTVDLSDFANPKYVGKFDAKQIEADAFVSRFSKFGGHLFGKINLEGGYSAKGWEPDAFLNSLTMNSVGSLDDGKLITSGATQQLLSSLAEQTGESFSPEQAIKKLWTNIKVEDGKVHLDDMKSRLGNIGDISINGYFGFDDAISYSGSLLLSEEMTKKLTSRGGLMGGLAAMLSDNKTGRINLPIKISGTIYNPVAGLDMSSLQGKATENLKDNAENLLKGLFKK